MQKTQNRMVTNAPQRIRKSIGRTAYEVTLHFSSTSTENPYDKLKRIFLNDCTDLKKNSQMIKNSRHTVAGQDGMDGGTNLI